jgi:hypothetical protein
MSVPVRDERWAASPRGPHLRARLTVEQQIIDAINRGWQREIERHEAIKGRLEQFLIDLDQQP